MAATLAADGERRLSERAKTSKQRGASSRVVTHMHKRRPWKAPLFVSVVSLLSCDFFFTLLLEKC